MPKRDWLIIAAVACTLGGSCGHSARSALPSCRFRIGDAVSRGGVGADVPERGHGVAGFADGPSTSSSMSISTSKDGVVTIVAIKDGVSASPEVCQLP